MGVKRVAKAMRICEVQRVHRVCAEVLLLPAAVKPLHLGQDGAACSSTADVQPASHCQPLHEPACVPTILQAPLQVQESLQVHRG